MCRGKNQERSGVANEKEIDSSLNFEVGTNTHEQTHKRTFVGTLAVTFINSLLGFYCM